MVATLVLGTNAERRASSNLARVTKIFSIKIANISGKFLYLPNKLTIMITVISVLAVLLVIDVLIVVFSCVKLPDNHNF